MVFEAAMNWATHHGAGRLFLISNSKLSPALHIYEKYGFSEWIFLLGTLCAIGMMSF